MEKVPTHLTFSLITARPSLQLKFYNQMYQIGCVKTLLNRNKVNLPARTKRLLLSFMSGKEVVKLSRDQKQTRNLEFFFTQKPHIFSYEEAGSPSSLIWVLKDTLVT